MTNRPGPDGFEQLEAELRGALQREADAVRPDDRLGDIRAAVSPTRRRPGSWWAPIAAAAAVAAIVVGGWLGLRPSAAPPPIPATRSTTAPVSPAPSTDTVHQRHRIPVHRPLDAPDALDTPTSTPSTPAPTVAVALPVYYLAPPGSSDGRYGLVRAFVPGQLPAGATSPRRRTRPWPPL